jgi:hypothetical protein
MRSVDLAAHGLGCRQRVPAPVAARDQHPFVDTQAVWKDMPGSAQVP